MMEIFGGIHMGQGALLLRPVRSGRMILSGVMNNLLAKDVEDQVWVTEVQLTPKKRLWLPKEYYGHRVDQILCSEMDVTSFKEVK